VKKILMVSLLIVIVAIAVVGGCSKSSTTTSTTQTTQTSTTQTTTSTAAVHKVLKIGYVQDMTAAAGIEGRKWVDLFAKLINNAGGWKIGSDIYDVQIISYDTQADATKAKNLLERVVLQDGVKFIVGGSPTGSPAVDMSVTEANKVVCFGTDMQDVTAGADVKYYYAVFGTFARGLMYQVDKDMLSEGFTNYVSVKTDTEMGKWADQLCDSTWQLVGKDKVTKLGSVFFDPSASDFGPIATKIMALNPQMVDMNFSSNIVQLYSALYDAGYKGRLLPSFADEALVANIVTKTGPAFAEGGECVSQDPRGYQKDPEMVAFMDAYTKEYGNFRTEGCMSVQSWFLLRDAINRAGSVDVEAVNNALGSSKSYVRTMTGYVELFARPDKDNLRTCHSNAADLVARIVNGKLTIVTGLPVKTHYLASILSYGWVDIYHTYWDKYGYPPFPADQKASISFADLGIQGHD